MPFVFIVEFEVVLLLNHHANLKFAFIICQVVLLYEVFSPCKLSWVGMVVMYLPWTYCEMVIRIFVRLLRFREKVH